METIVREMNYCDGDVFDSTEQFEADYIESVSIRRLETLERSGYFGRKIFRVVGKVVKYFNG